MDHQAHTWRTWGQASAIVLAPWQLNDDMGDPAGACAHVREHVAPDGTLMIIEPYANDDIADNLTPVGAAYYGFSTLLCTPSSLSQDVGTALGAQAGEARLRGIVTRAGFGSLRRVAETPVQHRPRSQAVSEGGVDDSRPPRPIRDEPSHCLNRREQWKP